ncbi:MAG: uroporphyrinogen decarboxylase family protein [Anaerolineae bacterium]
MNSRERVLSAVARKGFDRIPVHHEGTPEVNTMLRQHFGVQDDLALAGVLGDDWRYVDGDFCGPERRRFPDGSVEGLWGERYGNIPYGDGLGTYPEAVYLPFADMEDPSELDGYPFPSADWYDYSTVAQQCAAVSDHAVFYGGAGDMDFMNSIARCRGVEKVLFDVATEDPVYLRLVEQRAQFFYERAEKVLQAAGGQIDFVHCGEDLGTQRGPIISQRSFDRLFKPHFKALFELVHRYGARNLMHSCGSVRAFIPSLIDIGLDVLDVVQVAAEGMELEGLKRDFGRDLCFSGTMCVQSILPFGSVADVERETRRRIELFHDGGLILGPTHAIQVFTPLENILAMYRTAGSLDESKVGAAAPGRVPFRRR